MTNIWRHHEGIDLDVAAIFDPFGNCGAHGAFLPGVVGEDVLITGAGPIGIMAAAVARHAAARYTVITDLNPYRLELASKLGVTRAVNVREQKLPDVQKELGMTEGFDVGLEMSGNPAGLPRHAGQYEPRSEDCDAGHPERRDGNRLAHSDLQTC